VTLADLLGSVLRALRHADPASSRVPSCRGCVSEPEPEPFAIAAGGQPDEALVPRDTGLLGGLELGGPAMEVMLSQTTGIPALLMHQEAASYGTRQLPRAATCGPDPVGLDYSIWPGPGSLPGLGSSLSDLLRRLSACALPARRPDGADPA
jgi:hypothetical protein